MVEWWTCLLRCSALWSANRLEEAATLYPDIDDLFPALYQVSQPRTPNLQAEHFSRFSRSECKKLCFII